ncbi:MAG: ribonuclease HIII [Eubacteriaceae bacterium]|jgi:ribonuclease HIII|nr:ribonuclease HIII [Eubacteriaceae bacterium]
MEGFRLYIESLSKHLASRGILASLQRDLPFGKQLLLKCGERSDVVRVYYNSKGSFKVDLSTVQGAEARNALEAFLSQSNSQAEYPILSPPLIGSDESGKGDLFGALCVAAAFCDEHAYKELERLGVRDSKRLTDSFMESAEKEILKICPAEIAVLTAGELNKAYKMTPNLSILLGKLHAQALERLANRTGCQSLLTDRFSTADRVKPYLSNKSLKLKEETKAERNMAVAAASVLARCAFLRDIRRLSEHYQIDIAYGAGKAADASGRAIYANYGIDGLKESVKTHFRNMERIARSGAKD